MVFFLDNGTMGSAARIMVRSEGEEPCLGYQYGHEQVGADYLKNFLNRIKCRTKILKKVFFLYKV